MSEDITEKESTELVQLKEDDKQLLQTLDNINQVAKSLAKIDSEESVLARNRVVNALYAAFANKRFKSNLRLEELKDKLIDRVVENADNLDIATALMAIKDLHTMTSNDLDRALGINAKGAAVQVNLTNMNGNQTFTDKPVVNVSAESLSSVSKINEAINILKDLKVPTQDEIIDVEAEVVDGNTDK